MRVTGVRGDTCPAHSDFQALHRGPGAPQLIVTREFIMNRKLAFAAIGTIVALLCTTLIWYFYPSIKGYYSAKNDLKNNQPRLLLYGELMPYEPEAKQILITKYGIVADRVAGCNVSDSLLREIRAYNDVVKEHLHSQGIEDIWRTVIDEAKALNPDIHKRDTR